MAYHSDLHFKATELRLGLPGAHDEQQAPSVNNKKRTLSDTDTDCGSRNNSTAPPTKAQIVGWPPVRSCRKKSLFEAKKSGEMDAAMYVKVSMDGAAYLRKIDLKVYSGYSQLLKGLEAMFKFNVGRYSEREGYKGSEYAPTYQDKDGDWMLVGDVPWDMFISSCTKLRIMKGSEAKGLTCGL